MDAVAETVGRRLGGERASRTKALLIAGGSAVVVAAVVYKLLRAQLDGDQP